MECLQPLHLCNSITYQRTAASTTLHRFISKEAIHLIPVMYTNHIQDSSSLPTRHNLQQIETVDARSLLTSSRTKTLEPGRIPLRRLPLPITIKVWTLSTSGRLQIRPSRRAHSSFNLRRRDSGIYCWWGEVDRIDRTLTQWRKKTCSIRRLSWNFRWMLWRTKTRGWKQSSLSFSKSSTGETEILKHFLSRSINRPCCQQQQLLKTKTQA